MSFDPDRMLPLLRAHLRLGAWRIRELRLDRIRHRPGERTILQYSLQLVDARTGDERQQWLAASIYPGDRAAHLARKLTKQLARQDCSAFPFELVAYVPELGMLVQLFPQDRRLPALLELMRDPIGVLANSRGGRRAYVDCRVTPVRYRAGLSAVVRCDFSGAVADEGTETEDADRTSGHETLFAKVYPDDEQGPRTVDLLRAVERWNGPIRGVRPVAQEAQTRVLFLEAARGDPYQDRLLAGEGLIDSQRIGKALAEFHRSEIRSPRRHAAADQLANVRRATQRLLRACPDLHDELSAAARIAEGLEDRDFVPTHRDLKTEHIFLDGEAITLIDWDSCAHADPLLDIAMLAGRLLALAARDDLPIGPLLAARDALLAEYFEHVPRTWCAGWRAHWAGALLEIANGFHSRQEPRWHAVVRSLTHWARHPAKDGWLTL